jgi:hypothetical protein
MQNSMLRQFMSGTVFLAMIATGQVYGQETTATVERPAIASAEALGVEEKLQADGTDLGSATAPKVLLVTIARWLSVNFDLPLVLDPPRIASVPLNRMVTLYQAPITKDDSQTEAKASHNIVAVYSDAERTIYLPEGWTGETPAELSILVHELVHHIQHASGLTYACVAAREKVAYSAQSRWLQLFDRDLASEFGIDPFTLLVNTSCIN